MTHLIHITPSDPHEPCAERPALLRQAQDEREGYGAQDERRERDNDDRKARFLERLSLTGNVRSACRAIAITPMTAYRWRRACAHFASGWEAALVVARAHAEEVLADRALNGVEEKVFYHGEEVATRIRYDNRLLLAHLARLDAKAEDRDLAEAAADFDTVLEHFAKTGEMPPAREPSLHELPAQDAAAGDTAPAKPVAPWEDDSVPVVERALLYFEALEAAASDDGEGDEDEAMDEADHCPPRTV